MKYRIFVDTNQLFNEKGPLDQPFNLAIPSLQDFLIDHGVKDRVEICLPEIVIEERIQQKMEAVTASLQIANENIKKLEVVGHKTKSLVAKDYEKILRDNAKDFIKKNKVKKIPIPSTTKKELINRAIIKMRPFVDGDMGFKDTLIYLSLVEDALDKDSAVDGYIFCTGDGGFNEEVQADFKEQTGKDLHIVKNFSKVQEKLDELLPLSLHLEQRNDRIKEILLKKTGSVTLFLNKTQIPQSSNPVLSGGGGGSWDLTSWKSMGVGSAGTRNWFSEDNPDQIVGYDFSNMDVFSIDDNGDNQYTVLVEVQTNILYKDNDQPILHSVATASVYYNTSASGSYKPRIKTFIVQMTVNLGTQEVDFGYVTTSAFMGRLL